MPDNPVTLNSITMSRLRIFADRAKAHNDERSLESWVEELIDQAIVAKGRSWDYAETTRSNKAFRNDMVSLGVFAPNGTIAKPDVLAKLVQKYHILQGKQQEV